MSAPLVFAQATNAAAAAPGGLSPQMMQIVLLVGMFALFYFLMIRPQQKRMKEHKAMITAVKRGDTVVLSSGVIGKVVRVEEAEVGVEIATGVTIKVVKTMIADIRVKGAPAPANDAKA
jgi:preprotein translocase subunit YajC